jgi:hypothetical protein
MNTLKFKQATAALLHRRLQLPEIRCRWGPLLPPSPGAAPQQLSTESSITTAAVITTVPRFRATIWCM